MKDKCLKRTALALTLFLLAACQNKGSVTFEKRTVRALTANSTDVATGTQLYSQNCASCHGDFATSTKAQATETQIFGALQNVPEMKSVSALQALTSKEVAQIAAALATLQK